MAEEFRLGKLSFPLSTQIKAVAKKIKEIPEGTCRTLGNRSETQDKSCKVSVTENT